VSIDQLAVRDTVTIILNCKARKSIATGTMIDVYLSINKDNYLLSNLKKELLVGRIPVLILDIAPGHLSGHDLMDVLDSIHIKYKYNTSYLANYDDYMSLFICLGGALNNVELSPSQANKIYSFLIQGGKVYMESGATWDMEEQSTLNGLFNIETVSNGNWFIYDSIYGVPGEFTKDMIFEYDHYEPYNNHYLTAVGSASPLLYSGKHDSACVIAYNEGNYKTIGSSFEFNSIVDVDSISTKENYLLGIIDFFELSDFILSSKPIISKPNNDLKIVTYPNPFKDKLTIRIHNPVGDLSSLLVYDISGRIVNKIIIPSSHSSDNIIETSWDGKDFVGNRLPKGFYILRLNTDNLSISKKVLFY